MERELTIAVKNVAGNRPGDFTTRFTPTIRLDNDASYYIGFNRIITMFFFHGLMSIQDTIIKKYLLVKIMVRHGKILILLKEFGLILILTIMLNQRQKRQMVRVMKTTQLR